MGSIEEILNQKGAVIAIKTDTVYGLVCNANDELAVKKIYEIKKRDGEKPIGIFIKEKKELKKYIDESTIDEKKQSIINEYWPGALTIIFKKKSGMYDYLTCKGDSIGIRIPDDKDLLELLDNIDFPLAQTSCNLSGESPYINANMIKEKIGDKVDAIIDGGEIKHNVSSTVVDFSNDTIKVLRAGDIKIIE